MDSLALTLEAAVKAGHLLAASRENMIFLLEKAGASPVDAAAVRELAERGQWTELNDRFYQTLKFGTGGLRGRTIGRVVAEAERGTGTDAQPQHPAAGTNTMNEFNVSRATQGLVNHLKQAFAGEAPRVVIAHDTRYFSRRFAELAAAVVARMGGVAFLFDRERSTPELSFAVWHLGAQAGIMLTASHNPPHDNGFKAYYADGGQLVEPEASAIIAEVMKIQSAQPEAAAHPGRVESIGAAVDQAYLDGLATLVLEPELLRGQSGALKMVFTPIHGTGIQSVPAILERFGIRPSVVAAQAAPDGGFPTVKSPNPENAEALALAIEQGRAEGADFIAGTDPDADRMGVAVRNAAGEFEILTGNMIGSVLAAYRIERLKAQGVLTASNSGRACLIKTFVTTDLQKSIAQAHGLKCVETLTGFKYIGAKLKEYEAAAGGRGGMDHRTWRQSLLEQSTFFVFGGEESYGYSGGDYVRDKDANAAVLMFTEAAAWAKSQGMTLLDYLDQLYVRHGLYLEKLGTLTFEGAEGAAKIKRLLQSYKDQPPRSLGGRRVERVQNFAEEDIVDADGRMIPKELMLMFHAEGGTRVAVRGSGTEPKIKFYFFGRSVVPDAAGLTVAKLALRKSLDALWEETQADVKQRVG
jgi:phosphoglucomutase